MECPRCHFENREDSRFCAGCAMPLGKPGLEGASLTKTLETPVHVLKAGTLIAGKYRILEEIGRGGMGVVHKAEDLKLKRCVALKFLPPHLIDSPGLRERFLFEAQSAAGLSHPNICVIHEVGESEERPYIAMEFVEGETLSEKIERGPLGTAEALDYAAQIAAGLAEAHHKGIIHRDIKSSNIMVTEKGQAKVMDFGLAKLRGGSSLTKSRTTLGTIAYMSPEQARGEDLDARTDIWSLGVVLFELLAGKLPFRGDHDQAVIHSILHKEPEPLTKINPGTAPELEQIIGRAVAKKLADRYQTMEELADDLAAVAEGFRPPGAKGRGARRKVLGLPLVFLLAAALVVGLALFGLNAGGVRDRILGRNGASSGPIKMAVLPFANLTGEPAQENFTDGLTEEMITQLGRLNPQRLSVIARTSAMRYKKTEKPIEQIGRELGVAYVLEGSARREGGRVRINAQLVRVRDQTQQWADSYERELTGILALQSEVAQGVARSLAVALIPSERERMTGARPVQPEAYEQFQMGRYRLAERTVPGIEAAIGHFERAVAMDPAYALAYAGLADAQVLLPYISGNVSPSAGRARADAAANRALALDPTLGQAHAALGLAREFEYSWDAAEDHFRRAIELDPSYPSAHHWYADMLARRGRPSEALVQIRKALELDPLSAIINQDLGYVLALAGEREAAIRQYERTLELDPAFSTTWIVLALAQLEGGRFDDASRALSRWAELSGCNPAAYRQLVDLAAAYARTGTPQPMPADIDMAIPYAVPQIYMALGQKEQALNALERAYDRGFFSAVGTILSPVFEGLRDDPRFRTLLKETGFDIRRKD